MHIQVQLSQEMNNMKRMKIQMNHIGSGSYLPVATHSMSCWVCKKRPQMRISSEHTASLRRSIGLIKFSATPLSERFMISMARLDCSLPHRLARKT
uniref:Ovule protein n=1 Tax=Macrostomum lignano TaxID=282301 RepID=A0A1I8J8J1_9PLAT